MSTSFFVLICFAFSIPLSIGWSDSISNLVDQSQQVQGTSYYETIAPTGEAIIKPFSPLSTETGYPITGTFLVTAIGAFGATLLFLTYFCPTASSRRLRIQDKNDEEDDKLVLKEVTKPTVSETKNETDSGTRKELEVGSTARRIIRATEGLSW